MSSKNETRGGFRGRIYVGTAGETAKKLLTNVEDLSYEVENEVVDITQSKRETTGDLSPPVGSSWVVKRIGVIEWSMLDKSMDDILASLIIAARNGGLVGLVAIRVVNFDRVAGPNGAFLDLEGKGFDGDCSITVKYEAPVKGVGKYHFRALPCDVLRDSLLNV